jgi:hypothetical protein
MPRGAMPSIQSECLYRAAKHMPGCEKMYDEPREQERFIRLVGGTRKADRIMQLWGQSYPHSTSNIFKPVTKEDDFRSKALSEGFTKKQIESFLKLK